MNNEEVQELIHARNGGKKKDLRIWESDGMLMQESRMYVPNNAELKKEILDEACTCRLMLCIQEVLKCIIPLDLFIIGQA